MTPGHAVARGARQQEDGMKGPKRGAIAILVFFACSVLAVHLIDGLRAPVAATSAAPAPPVEPDGAPARAAPKVPAPAPALAVAAAARDPLEAMAPDALEAVAPDPLGVAPVPPARTAPAGRERALNDCVERSLAAAGYDQVKPTLPGRWPALKRAREQQRQRRLALRARCEQELAL